MDIEEAPIQKKIDGRTKAGRVARMAAARTERRQERVIETPKAAARSTAVRGRSGEVLSRKRKGTADPFEIPENLKEPGWDYQWIAHSVIGNTDVVMDQNLGMLENGWRPVHADRPGFAGRFMPAGQTGHIMRGGQGLYERPKSLSDEARVEDLRAARQLMSDRNDALKLSGVNKSLPQGFDPLTGSQRRVLKTGGDNVRMSIDASLDADIPRPSYNIAESE